MVAWEQGVFELTPPTHEEFMIELDESTEGLLMEALRQLDELRRIQAELPPLSAQLALETPLAAPLRDLEPEQLDTLQLVINFQTLQDILDQADGTDLETSQQLLKLVRKGYVRDVAGGPAFPGRRPRRLRGTGSSCSTAPRWARCSAAGSRWWWRRSGRGCAEC